MKRENNYFGLLETGRRHITILALGKIDEPEPNETFITILIDSLINDPLKYFLKTITPCLS
jgi:hypothetical protein